MGQFILPSKTKHDKLRLKVRKDEGRSMATRKTSMRYFTFDHRRSCCMYNAGCTRIRVRIVMSGLVVGRIEFDVLLVDTERSNDRPTGSARFLGPKSPPGPPLLIPISGPKRGFKTIKNQEKYHYKNAINSQAKRFCRGFVGRVFGLGTQKGCSF